MSKIEVTKDMLKLADSFAVYINALDMIAQIGNLDNAVAERQQAVAQAVAERNAVAAEAQALADEIKKLTGKKSDAQLAANQMLKDAEAKASLIVEQAVEDAKSVREQAQAQILAAQLAASDELQAVREAIGKAQQELYVVKEEIASAVKEKTSFEKAVEALKRKFIDTGA